MSALVDLAVREATADDAEAVTEVIHEAFAGRPALEPPSTALDETEATVRAALAAGAGLLATVDGEPAGSMLFAEADDPDGRMLLLRRVSVLPHWQGRGVATAMVGVAEEVAHHRNLAGVRLAARRELAGTVAFWERRGYTALDHGSPELIMRKVFGPRDGGQPGVRALTVPTAEAMRLLGRVVAGELRAGDLVLLAGELGAGKTTLTQGIGRGLEVEGEVISPTFVLARIHRPARQRRPMLVHVDAYRLSSAAELDDLDLEASMDRAVTVVEWGEGVAESLSPDRLLVRLERRTAAGASDGDGGGAGDAAASTGSGSVGATANEDHDPRVVTLTGFGDRWHQDALDRVAHRYQEYVAAPVQQPAGGRANG